MFKVKYVRNYGTEESPKFQAVVDLSGSNSFLKNKGKEEKVDNLVVEVYFHHKTSQWRAKLPLVWHIMNEKLGCVQKMLPKRNSKIKELQEKLTTNPKDQDSYTKMIELMYNWNPCGECKYTTTCDKKYLVHKVYPKVRINGGSTSNTWIVAMNVASAIAKAINPKYPAHSTKSSLWEGARKCSDCAFCTFIKRDNDPDCIDAVQGVATADPEQYSNVERTLSTMDQRHQRDTRAPQSYMRCSFTQQLVWDHDACSDYVWRALLNRHCDWVPASPSATIKKDSIIGGVGEFSIELTKEALKYVQIRKN